MASTPLIAAVTDFDQLPIPGGVLTLDGTIVAANAAGARLMARPVGEFVGRKAWDFAPGAEHIWAELIAGARQHGAYSGQIVIATPRGPRAIQYSLALRTHEADTVVVLFAVEINPTDEPVQLR